MIDDPGLAFALDTVIARTGHRRYRDLCDPEHPDFNPGYIPIVRALAERPGPTSAPIPAGRDDRPPHGRPAAGGRGALRRPGRAPAVRRLPGRRRAGPPLGRRLAAAGSGAGAGAGDGDGDGGMISHGWNTDRTRPFNSIPFTYLNKLQLHGRVSSVFHPWLGSLLLRRPWPWPRSRLGPALGPGLRRHRQDGPAGIVRLVPAHQRRRQRLLALGFGRDPDILGRCIFGHLSSPRGRARL